VAPAARDDAGGRFRAGEAVGYVNDQLVAWGDPVGTLRATLATLAEGCEVVTCLAGEHAPLGEADVEAALPDGVELDHHDGGQAAWWWLLAAE
jgi:hypothetical protein